MITVFFVGAALLIFDIIKKSDVRPVVVRVKAYYTKRKGN
jgi:hypothetical protein